MRWALVKSGNSESEETRGFVDESTLAKVKELQSNIYIAVKNSVASWQKQLSKGKKPKSPLAKLFKSSENSLYPTKSHQYVSFEVQIFGRTSDYENQLNKHLEFVIPVSNKYFEIQETLPAANISVKVSGNLALGKMKLTFFDAQGNSKEVDKNLTQQDYSLELNESNGYGFLDGSLYFDGERVELDLPGNDSYKIFELYAQYFRIFDLTRPGIF